MKSSSRKVKSLQLLSAIGFTGKVVGGLHVQREDRGLVYPVGVGVGVWDRSGGRHALLHAHTRPVTALTVSRSGRLIVSAQNSDPGCQAVVVVWRYKEREELGRHKVHREEVTAVAMSSGEEYVVDEAEEFLYAATSSGDVVKVRLNSGQGEGIQALVLLGGDLLLAGDVGGGVRAYRQLQEEVRQDGRPKCPDPPRAHGTLKYTHPKDPTRPLLQQVWCVDVGGAVTSLSVVGPEVVVGTVTSEIYTFRLPSKHVPHASTHPRIGGVRVWNVRSLKEALRVELKGLVCCCCCVTHTLHTIVTGWSDGRLRGLGAESGRVLWVVDDAHHAGVNAVVTLPTGTIISGGRDGRLERVKRLRAHTVFLGGVVLRCGEVVTTGSDGAVMVWDRLDGTLLADLPSSQQPLTCLAVTKDDSTLVTAGEDAVVRVWNWKKGRVTHEGRGHSGAITKVAISPDARLLATAGKDGALLFWKLQ
ncbi:hypothetical protein Pmani_036955 [Petrolisthes manimaculis]|uniref:Uncharacterized protein n=1 Tax=Petrolisthes manimaculis TaxID=1843537 RepID=A0AAE1NHT2_9EUCA|nr:hypothetical protein Pmani_036955 [Petrolisthes manimaculis]